MKLCTSKLRQQIKEKKKALWGEMALGPALNRRFGVSYQIHFFFKSNHFLNKIQLLR